MANHNRDDLENQGNASLGILGVLGAVAVAAGVNASSNKKKAAKNSAERAKLKSSYEAELRSVQSKLSSYRGKFMSSILYSDEISKLEKQEKELINAIKQL